MAAATAKIPMSRILMCDNYEFGYSGNSVMNLSDTIFEFLDESSEGSPENTNNSGYDENESEDGDEEKENSKNAEEDKAFWETQHQILHDTLCRSTSLESKIRNATKEAIKEAPMAGNFCVCRRPVAGGCRNCLMREICSRLRNAGFNSAICKSKWRSSPDIPSGEHTFLDVVEPSASKKTEVRVIIEINFRSEFEVARASEEYKQLTKKLPEVFVGKVERLHNLIKILCSAAKKCMRESKMHMGPWRKHRYMQAKWLTAARERAVEAASPLPTVADGWSGSRGRAARPRASMLTVDLLDINVPNLHMTVVEVV
ncbi:DNA mismatch repair protein like [Actinidia chinensis var. chinensis]|uniref:DNA mismatch repair protein like n=1 Tax=Actinidia chinensis var. chinensis TaxID=1590841 RepID=A0A2R6QA77_ACTCC|nr:DNA mismatch repair protein like [Actinidia chinensis var. chinensis]